MNGQKLLLAFGSVCLTSAVVFAYFSLPSAPEGLVATDPVVDLGTLEQGQTVKAEFHLQNHFRQRVDIHQILESCGCSATTVGSQSLEPGEETTLVATWKTGTSRGPTKVTMLVVYSLADGRRGEVGLAVRGEIIPDIEYEPSELFFEGGIQEKVIKLKPGRMKYFIIKEAYASHQAIKVTPIKEDKTILVRFDPRHWTHEEDFVPYVTVVTNSEREPRLMIPVKVAGSKVKE